MNSCFKEIKSPKSWHSAHKRALKNNWIFHKILTDLTETSQDQDWEARLNLINIE